MSLLFWYFPLMIMSGAFDTLHSKRAPHQSIQ
jgi:hypothetical protein